MAKIIVRYWKNEETIAWWTVVVMVMETEMEIEMETLI